MAIKDSFCSYCGTAFSALREPPPYPRTCPKCGVTVWANPIPVSVVLLPVNTGWGLGLLVGRRGITPGHGKLALVGGFVEDHEGWQGAGAREVREEIGVNVEASKLTPYWFSSTEPKPNRVLLFSVAPTLAEETLPIFVPNHETSQRGIVFGPKHLDEVFAFPLHVKAAQMWFEDMGITGSHNFVQL